MDRSLVLAASTVLLLSVAGCGTESSGAGSTTAENTAANYPEDPRQVVQEFLDASLKGDPRSGSKYLTPLALQKTQEYGMDVFLGGGESAQFTVGQVMQISKTKVTVQSIWTESDIQGRPQEAEIHWVLRKGTAGWQISGMEQRVSASQVIQVNYEDPEAMAEQDKRLRQEKNRPADEKFSEARPPIDRFQSGPR